MKRASAAFLLVLAACAAPAPKAPLKKSAGAPAKTVKATPAAAPKAAPAAPVKADPAIPLGPAAPVVLANLPSLNDFNLLANGGWNANWYLGYNTSWVVKLPPAPAGDYRKAYLGVKLGAMKTEAVPGRPTWERRPIPGEILAGVAPEPRWPASERRLVARTEDIPLEGNSDNALEGVGESRWFWTEIPLASVSFESDNYVALFSPEEKLDDLRRAPVIAAGANDGKLNAWLNTGVAGAPPLTAAEALLTPVVSYEPGVAIKLVSAREDKPVVLWRRPPARGASVENRITLEAAVSGTDLQSAWVEAAADGQTWRRVGRPQWGAPYVFTLRREELPAGAFQVRIAAKDVWENVGVSLPLTLKSSRR